jgi:hypothetical protein
METWTTFKEFIHITRWGSLRIRHYLYIPFKFSALTVFGNSKTRWTRKTVWNCMAVYGVFGNKSPL